MRTTIMRHIIALATMLVAAQAAADAPEDVLEAMEVDLSECYNVVAEGTNGQRVELPNLGIVQPQYGATMAFLASATCANIYSCVDEQVSYTSMGTDPISGYPIYDMSSLEMDCDVPADAHSFGFSFYFFSREYPDYVNSTFNDRFQVYLTSAAWNGNVVFDAGGNTICVNNALFTVTNQALLAGTGFDCVNRGGGTGWLTTVAPVVPEETVHIRFEVYDCSDGVWDSAVLLDDFYWSEQDPKAPTTGNPVEVWFLSPKEGPIAGGDTVTVYGKNFTADTRLYFGTTQAGATLMDSGRMQVVTPAWDEPELVDVTAANEDFDYTLAGAYSYVEEGAEGEQPPELFFIDPEHGLPDGGETVQIHGENFREGSIAYFDGLEALTSYDDPGQLQAITPGHDPGTVEVVVFNPDGQYTEPIYYFTYDDVEETEETEPGPNQDDDDGSDCSCNEAGRSAGPAAGGLAAAVGALLLRRRGR